jgi:hypothetical protein
MQVKERKERENKREFLEYDSSQRLGSWNDLRRYYFILLPT